MISRSPDYKTHRVIAANEGVVNPHTFGIGANGQAFQKAMIQVIPISAPMTTDAIDKGALPSPGTSTPIVEVLWWSKVLGQYFPGNPPITKTGPGAGTPFEFEIDCLGRMFMVRLNSGLTATQAVIIAVSGYNPMDVR